MGTCGTIWTHLVVLQGLSEVLKRKLESHVLCTGINFGESSVQKSKSFYIWFVFHHQLHVWGAWWMSLHSCFCSCSAKSCTLPIVWSIFPSVVPRHCWQSTSKFTYNFLVECWGIGSTIWFCTNKTECNLNYPAVRYAIQFLFEKETSACCRSGTIHSRCCMLMLMARVIWIPYCLDHMHLIRLLVPVCSIHLSSNSILGKTVWPVILLTFWHHHHLQHICQQQRWVYWGWLDPLHEEAELHSY